MLRSRDAIHLASALAIGDVPEESVTYDDRLAAAAKKPKMRVIQPGRGGHPQSRVSPSGAC